MGSYTVRRSRPADAELLPQVEIAAGRLFSEIGMADVAGHDPTSVEDHLEAIELGQHWVAVDENDRAVGFALVHVHGGCAHLEEIAVHPDHGRHGLGRRLLDAVVAWARGKKLPAVTLTTFRDVAFNGPWYRRYGFRDLSDAELSPDLRAIRDEEGSRGLDSSKRVCMRLELR